MIPIVNLFRKWTVERARKEERGGERAHELIIKKSGGVRWRKGQCWLHTLGMVGKNMGFGSQALILAVPFLSVWPWAKYGIALSLFPQLLKKEQ